jgi:hypothetical protein
MSGRGIGRRLSQVKAEAHARRPTPVFFRDQLIPFYTLRPRTDDKSIG